MHSVTERSYTTDRKRTPQGPQLCTHWTLMGFVDYPMACANVLSAYVRRWVSYGVQYTSYRRMPQNVRDCAPIVTSYERDGT